MQPVESKHFESKHFEFEADFVKSLRCIPMGVRYKLDIVGIKLKLEHWHQFSYKLRQTLVEAHVEEPESIAHYRTLLEDAVKHHSSVPLKELPIDPNPPWNIAVDIPDSVQQKAAELNVAITLEDWKSLSPLERFALIKLSRPSHENHNFLPALKEFGIIPD
ncbi:MAG: nitrate reductase maturation protein NarM [Oscillatoriales cyanobacterium SM2_3_0]|nr:nitrate reductase maturation protein NarM [Oscillatoriales cyanobacterium SM2_3_0]